MYGNDIIALVSGKSLEDLDTKEEIKPSTNQLGDLESALKQHRLNKSRKLGYTPYFIYNNEEMNNIIAAKPTTKEELLKIAGFGEKKYEMYGEDIISIIRKYL
jgi:superfamily II DNA helicase RecQ